MGVLDVPAWPNGDPGRVLLHLDASCSVDKLFECFFGNFSEFQAQVHKDRGDSNLAESPWVMNRSELPAEQYVWPGITPGPAAGSPKAGAMRKVRFEAPPSALSSKGFSSEEIAKVKVYAPGSHYQCETEVYTNAMYGDKFVILTRYTMVARGPGAAALHITYALTFSAAMSGLIKPMVVKGVDNGIRGSFTLIRKMLAAQCAVHDRPDSAPPPALPGAAPEAPAPAPLVAPAPAPIPVAAGGGLGGALGLGDFLVYQELVVGLTGLPDPAVVAKTLAVIATLLLLSALVPLVNTLAAPVHRVCGAGAQGVVASLCWPLGHLVQPPDSVAEVIGSLLLVWAANKLLVVLVAFLAEHFRQRSHAAAAAPVRQPSMQQPAAPQQPSAAAPASPAAAAPPKRGMSARGRGRQKNPAAVHASASAPQLPTGGSSAAGPGRSPSPAVGGEEAAAGAGAGAGGGAATTSPLGDGLQALSKAVNTWGRSWLGNDVADTINNSGDSIRNLLAGNWGSKTAAQGSTSSPADGAAAAAAAAAGGGSSGGAAAAITRSGSGEAAGSQSRGRHSHQPSFTALIHDPAGFTIIEDYAQASAAAAAGAEEGPRAHELALTSLDEEGGGPGSGGTSRASSPDKGLLPPSGSASSRSPSPERMGARSRSFRLPGSGSSPDRAASSSSMKGGRTSSPSLATTSVNSVGGRRTKSPGPWARSNSLQESLDAVSSGLQEEEEGDEVDAEVFEYERHQPFRGWGHTWPGHFLPSDKVGHWGDRQGGPGGQASELFERVVPRLPIGWVWGAAQWEVDMMPLDWDGVDGEGWSYGVDFNWLVWPPQQGMGKAGYKDWTRRRRWVRQRVRVTSLGENPQIVTGADGQPMVVLPRSSSPGRRRLTLNSEAVRRAAGVGGRSQLQVNLSAKSVPADLLYGRDNRYLDSSEEEEEEERRRLQQQQQQQRGQQPADAAAEVEEVDSHPLASAASESVAASPPKAAAAAGGGGAKAVERSGEGVQQAPGSSPQQQQQEKGTDASSAAEPTTPTKPAPTPTTPTTTAAAAGDAADQAAAGPQPPPAAAAAPPSPSKAAPGAAPAAATKPAAETAQVSSPASPPPPAAAAGPAAKAAVSAAPQGVGTAATTPPQPDAKGKSVATKGPEPAPPSAAGNQATTTTTTTTSSSSSSSSSATSAVAPAADPLRAAAGTSGTADKAPQQGPTPSRPPTGSKGEAAPGSTTPGAGAAAAPQVVVGARGPCHSLGSGDWVWSSAVPAAAVVAASSSEPARSSTTSSPGPAAAVDVTSSKAGRTTNTAAGEQGKYPPASSSSHPPPSSTTTATSSTSSHLAAAVQASRGGGAALQGPTPSTTPAPRTRTASHTAAPAPAGTAAAGGSGPCPSSGPSAGGQLPRLASADPVGAEEEEVEEWCYQDAQGQQQGPASIKQLRNWADSVKANFGEGSEAYREYMAVEAWRQGKPGTMVLEKLLRHGVQGAGVAQPQPPAPSAAGSSSPSPPATATGGSSSQLHVTMAAAGGSSGAGSSALSPSARSPTAAARRLSAPRSSNGSSHGQHTVNDGSRVVLTGRVSTSSDAGSVGSPQLKQGRLSLGGTPQPNHMDEWQQW